MDINIEEARETLECAMGYGYTIRAVYRGQVYQGPVRPSPYHPLSRFQIKESRAVEYQLAPWRPCYDPEEEGWMELFIDLDMLTEVSLVKT